MFASPRGGTIRGSTAGAFLLLYVTKRQDRYINQPLLHSLSVVSQLILKPNDSALKLGLLIIHIHQQVAHTIPLPTSCIKVKYFLPLWVKRKNNQALETSRNSGDLYDVQDKMRQPKMFSSYYRNISTTVQEREKPSKAR